ncbi:hypothetical protein [Roseibium sp. M-1]
MAGKDEKTDQKPAGLKSGGLKSGGLKSVGVKSASSKAPLRSRGYLSQPGGSVPAASGDGDATAHHGSRGARQISANTDGKPQDLVVKPVIKPFRLEDK